MCYKGTKFFQIQEARCCYSGADTCYKNVDLSPSLFLYMSTRSPSITTTTTKPTGSIIMTITMQADLLLLVLPFVLLVSLIYLGLTLVYPKCKRSRLPPGTMGWPFIGETKKLYSQNPNTFYKERQSKYGEIFKTRILGCSCVMISSAEAARNILVSEAHRFKPAYPRSKERLIGPEAIFFQQGDYHANLRKLVLSTLVPASIKDFVGEIENIVLGFLPSWENNTVNTLKEMKRFTFDVVMFLVLGNGLHSEKELIKYLYECLDKGYNCMPINFPGFQYRKSLMARRKLHQELKRMIEERKRRGRQGEGLLGAFLDSRDGEHNRFKDSQIADNVIGVIFAARDTTSSILTWILKYLHEDPELLAAVVVEQEKIQKQILKENRRLAWEDTRRMPLTCRVIQETMRAASVLSFTFREAVEDIEFQSYVIPKGWKVLPLFRSIHHCKDFFPEPEKFDPSRFEVAPKPNTYLPFGKGVHSCPGNELAKLEMLILIHHLTITYRWEIVGDKVGTQYGPFLVPKGGLPIRVTKKKKP